MSDDHISENAHWSYSKGKYTLTPYGPHASTLLPIVTWVWFHWSFWWIVVWIAVDYILTSKKLTLRAMGARIQLMLGRYLHGGYRLRINKLKQFKIKRG